MRVSMVVVLVAVFLASPAAAQPPDGCSEVTRPAPRPNAPPVAADRVAGQTLFAFPGEARDRGGASHICLAVFDLQGRLVTDAVADASGRFELQVPGPGDYVLVAGRPGLRTLAVPLTIAAPRVDSPSRGMSVHMRAIEDERAGSVTAIANLELRDELLAMVRADQDVRREMIDRGVQSIAPELEARIARIDAANAARVVAIVERYGWPVPSLVGFDGSEAATTMVQHFGLEVQRRMLPLVEAAWRDGVIPGQSFALLIDRVRYFEGRPQIYGTQALPFDQWKGGTPALAPIEDAANADRRRAEVGLPPLAEYVTMLRKLYFP